MTNALRATSVSLMLWSVAILAAVAIGVHARAEDPLSSPVIPAEDPYTHMALVREHLRDGSLDPLNTPGTLYPPGMHAMLAAVWVYTGVDLYDIVRFSAVAFGALGILGVALLLARFEGRVAALFGVAALALAPEAVFRTTMLAPTAVDLAVLPFLLYAMLRLVQGGLAWAAAAGPLSLFLAFSHPWVFAVLGLTGAAFVALAVLLPWPQRSRAAVSAQGLVAAGAIVGAGVALALSGCWGACGPGFRDIVGPDKAAFLGRLAGVVMGASVILAALLVAAPRSLDRLAPLVARDRPAPAWLGAAVCVGVLATVSGATALALQRGMPADVDLPRMFGWPLLLAAAAGLLTLPFVWGPAGHVGTALFAATYPFVVFDPFHSPFWPHRTAVYLGLALVVLGAVAVGAATRAAAAWMARSTGEARPRARPAHAVLPALLVLASLGGVYAATPPPYDGGWYRLYEPCEMDALRETAALADEAPDALVVTGSWQAKLVLAALATDASRVWYKLDLFTSAEGRDAFLDHLAKQGRPVIAVVDPYLARDHDGTDPAFLEAPPWSPAGAWPCPGTTGATAAVRAYAIPEATT